MFSVFRKVIDDEVGSLNSEAEDLAARPALATEPNAGDGTNYAQGQLDPAESLLVMNADPRLLELLDGRMQISLQNPHLYLVHSDIYVAPANGATQVRPIGEDYELDPTNYETTRSVHLAAIYYALAVDAARRSCRPIQVSYLSRAAEVLKDVHHQGSGALRLRNQISKDQHGLGLSP